MSSSHLSSLVTFFCVCACVQKKDMTDGSYHFVAINLQVLLEAIGHKHEKRADVTIFCKSFVGKRILQRAVIEACPMCRLLDPGTLEPEHARAWMKHSNVDMMTVPTVAIDHDTGPNRLRGPQSSTMIVILPDVSVAFLEANVQPLLAIADHVWTVSERGHAGALRFNVKK